MLFTIKRAAELVRVTAQTLRVYEADGLLSPVRDNVGRRLFSEMDVEQARRIAADRAARVALKRQRPNRVELPA